MDKFSHDHPFDKASEILKNGNIVIIYPEGTRNTSEDIGEFKKGIAHLAKLNPEVPLVPIYIHGPGMVLPKGEGLLVPFICDVYVGNEVYWNGNADIFTKGLKEKVEELRKQHYSKEIK